jgi:zinc and cadmium transporter
MDWMSVFEWFGWASVSGWATGFNGGTLVAQIAAGGVLSTLLMQCVIVMFASLLGGWIPSRVRLTHRRLQFLISLVGGLMLGVGVLHQLPHGYAIASDAGLGLDWCVRWLLGGMLLTFFLLRWFHFHSHGPAEELPAAPLTGWHDHDHDHGRAPSLSSSQSPAQHTAARHDHDHEHDHSHDHDHNHAHSHAHAHGHSHGHSHAVPFGKASWLGILIGLSLHTLLDGIAMAAHVEADALHLGAGSPGWLLGVGTFLGVALHKPLDSLSITTLMAARGWSSRAQTLVNLAYACMCPFGVLLFVWGVNRFSGQQAALVSAAMSAAAGVFICIALSDLLPEIEMHSHDRLGLSLTLVAGVLLAWAIGFLEPAHSHGGEEPAATGNPAKAGSAKAVPHDHAHDHDHDH